MKTCVGDYGELLREREVFYVFCYKLTNSSHEPSIFDGNCLFNLSKVSWSIGIGEWLASYDAPNFYFILLGEGVYSVLRKGVLFVGWSLEVE